jgi:G3E family GTPase
VGIDDSLLQDKFAANEEIFQMNNGCICCTVRGDLIRILRELVKVSPPRPRPLTTSWVGPIKW